MRIGDDAVLRSDGTLEIRMELPAEVLAEAAAESALREGDLPEAIAQLSRAMELAATPNAARHVARGKAYYHAGDFARAIADFERALLLEPQFSDLHFEKGKAELRAGRHVDANDSFSRDLSLGDPSPISLFNRHIARKGLGDVEGALADLDLAVRALPDSVPMRLARSDLRSTRGDLRGALEDVNAAVAAQPNDGALHDRRARLAFRAAEYELAASDFRLAIALAEEDGGSPSPEWYAGEALSLGQLGRYDQAIAVLSRAIELNPDEPTMYCNRGWLLHLAARDDDALADLDRALALNAGYAKALHNRAFVRERRGDLAGARADYEQLRELGHDVSESLARLAAAPH